MKSGVAQLDHLVVIAANLAQGVRWCERTLGVSPASGGQHPWMGTHNRLLALEGGRFPRTYLEIIAIDPEAEPPARPRWFGMDDPNVRAAVRDTPQLMHIVVRTPAISMLRASLVGRGFDPGPVLAAQRATPTGPLQWQICVRDDGQLPAQGALPSLIAWGDRHPSDDLPASGVTLQRLCLHGLPRLAAQALDWPGADQRVAGTGAVVSARLQTPQGEVELNSPWIVENSP